MKDETIAALIDSVNERTADDRVFVRPIAYLISFGTVWTELPGEYAAQEQGHRFYFIHNSERRCIGAVYDMGASNLHVFVKPEYRRQGVMTTALQEVILPHLFRDGLSEQRVTFNSPESRGLLEKVGFEIVGDDAARITAERCKEVSISDDVKLPFPKERMKAIQKRMRHAAGLVRMASEECGLYLRPNFVERIEELEEDLRSLAGRVEDEWWKQKEPAQ